MALDVRTAETTLENLIRDAVLYALGARLPQQASVATLRTVQTFGPSGTPTHTDDALITVAGSPVLSYRWSTASGSADNGTTVIQPNDAGATGRWLQWVSPLRFSTVVGAASVTLDQIASGPLARVVVVDKNYTEEEVAALINGSVPAVLIEPSGDDPSDMVMPSGLLWNTTYSFTVTTLGENLRGNREVSLGSDAPGDPDPGVNQIDGFVKALLSGTQLAAVVDDIRNVRLSAGRVWVSKLGQRRVARSRVLKFQVTEKFPAAPGDSTVPTDAFVQPQLVGFPVPGLTRDPATQMVTQTQPVYDPSNYLVSGVAPTVGGALAQSLSAGSAKIAGLTVNYAGGAVTFPPYSDTYRDLLPNGTVTLISVTATGEAPRVTATALRVGVTTTSGSGVVADAILCQTQAPYGPDIDIPI